MEIAALITAFGLAGAAGLNAYIPLLMVGILGRLGVITLASPFTLLSNEWVLLVLGILLAVEFVIDKVPGADSLNDVIQTLVRPAAGAILFAAQSGAIASMPPELGLILGLVAAFGVHAAKAAARPVVNTTTMGVGGPVVSVLEDVTSAVASALAIFFPLLFLFFALIMVYVFYRVRRSILSRKQGSSAVA